MQRKKTYRVHGQKVELTTTVGRYGTYYSAVVAGAILVAPTEDKSEALLHARTFAAIIEMGISK